MHKIPQQVLTEFINVYQSNGKWNYDRIDLIWKIVKKSGNSATKKSRIETVNQLMYILPTTERSKELSIMCKESTVIMKDKNNEKDLYHMALFMDREEKPQVI